jgi:release factor glutamine methyltransferase
VEHLIRHFAGQRLTAVDVGTGSGCIAISLALALPNADIRATDVSEEALKIARQNANALQAQVAFHLHDILSQGGLTEHHLDLLVSNPPYIVHDEAGSLKANVLQYEPHLALFAPAHDPFIFYRRLAAEAITCLKPQGLLAVEINEKFGQPVKEIFQQQGLHHVEVKKDITGKDRYVWAQK